MNKLRSYAFFYTRFKENFLHKNVSTLHLLTKLYNNEYNTFNDRFNQLVACSEYNLISRCDDINVIYSQKLLSFEECCRKRTDEIISIAGEKAIYVAYSGGVDSTCIVCSFLMNENLKKDRFFVICNSFARDENKNFYEFLIKNKINLYSISENINDIVSISEQDVLIVNGNCGDQLDGSNIPTKRFPMISFYTPWIDALTFMCKRCKLVLREKTLEDIENYARYIGTNLKYIGDFGWLFNFGLKYSYVNEYMSLLSKRPENMITFFDTLYFQKYGLVNRATNDGIKSQQSSYLYKTDWKKFVYNYTKDYDFFLHKGKEATYIGTHLKADIGFRWRDEGGYNYIESPTNKDVEGVMKKYIKPEYQEFYILETY